MWEALKSESGDRAGETPDVLSVTSRILVSPLEPDVVKEKKVLFLRAKLEGQL